MFRLITYILAIIAFNQFIVISQVVKSGYFSEPNLTHPYIDKELLDSCGLRYGVIHRTIKYNKNCFFSELIVDRLITIPIKGNIETQRRGLPKTRVLGGRNVKYREAPWVVQIVKRQYSIVGTLTSIDHHCTGVLITMKYILTAAHCWQYGLRLSVYAGRDETVEGWRSTNFSFHQHPKYITGKDSNNNPIVDLNYDIGIIVLNEPIDWHKYGKDKNGMYLINTICLPSPEDFSDPKFADGYDTYRKATSFGWGRVYNYTFPRVIQRGDYLVKYRTDNINDKVDIFVSYAPGKEQRICKGDSGSGLIQYLDEYEMRAVLIGIVRSFRNKLGVKNPLCDYEQTGESHAVRVVHYLDWIDKYLKQN